MADLHEFDDTRRTEDFLGEDDELPTTTIVVLDQAELEALLGLVRPKLDELQSYRPVAGDLEKRAQLASLHVKLGGALNRVIRESGQH